jgi:hypothetical protein
MNMSKTKNIFFAALLMLAPLALCFAQENVNVSGEWDLTVTTPRGEMTSTAKFVQEGETITVTVTGRRGESTGTGTIKGADIEWTITRDTPRGQFTITYKGKVDGNTMKGEAQMGDFGSSEWKATKKASS